MYALRLAAPWLTVASLTVCAWGVQACVSDRFSATLAPSQLSSPRVTRIFTRTSSPHVRILRLRVFFCALCVSWPRCFHGGSAPAGAARPYGFEYTSVVAAGDCDAV